MSNKSFIYIYIKEKLHFRSHVTLLRKIFITSYPLFCLNFKVINHLLKKKKKKKKKEEEEEEEEEEEVFNHFRTNEFMV